MFAFLQASAPAFFWLLLIIGKKQIFQSYDLWISKTFSATINVFI